MLEITTFGRVHSYTVPSGAEAVWQSGMWPLAVPVALASVVLPAGLILVLLALSGARQSGVGMPSVATLAAALRFPARLGDRRRLSARDLHHRRQARAAERRGAGAGRGPVLRHGGVPDARPAQPRCRRCRSRARCGPTAGWQQFQPTPGSVNRTFALALGALILFVPANVFPTLTVMAHGSTQTATVFGGVVDLWQAGMWPLAIIVVCASLLIPFLKIIGLMFLTLTLGRPADRACPHPPLHRASRRSAAGRCWTSM